MVGFIKASSFRCAGHVEGMNDLDSCKKITFERPEIISQERHKTEWLDNTEKDIKQVKVKNWKQIGKERQFWKRVVK